MCKVPRMHTRRRHVLRVSNEVRIFVSYTVNVHYLIVTELCVLHTRHLYHHCRFIRISVGISSNVYNTLCVFVCVCVYVCVCASVRVFALVRVRVRVRVRERVFVLFNVYT